MRRQADSAWMADSCRSRSPRNDGAMAHEDHSQRSKQHAWRRDVRRRYPLWVYDDDDWSLMHGENKLPVGDLICPAPGCRAELVAVERESGTRFLRNRRGTADCGHAFGWDRRGGSPSAEHRWLQQRLAMLCDTLGYEAIQEHFESHADVWVASTPPVAIEIQRWPTAFASRSAARQSKGANVLWLLPESASSKRVGRELFRYPAARIRVMQREDRTKEATPWEPGHSGRVLLWVGATVMRRSTDGLTLVSAGNYDAREFLRELLEGERRWYGPNEPGFKFGSGWARPDDVEQVRAARHRAAASRLPGPLPTVVAIPPAAGTAPSVREPALDDQEHGVTPVAPEAPRREDADRHQISDATAKDAPPSAGCDLRPPELPVADVPARRGWLQRLMTWFRTGASR